eukprot:EG_transcript_12291
MDAIWLLQGLYSQGPEGPQPQSVSDACASYSRVVDGRLKELLVRKLRAACRYLRPGAAVRVWRWRAGATRRLLLHTPLRLDVCTAEERGCAADFLSAFAALPNPQRSRAIVQLMWGIWCSLPKVNGDRIDIVQWDWLFDRLMTFLAVRPSLVGGEPRRQHLDFRTFFEKMWALATAQCGTGTHWEYALFFHRCHYVIFQTPSTAVEWDGSQGEAGAPVKADHTIAVAIPNSAAAPEAELDSPVSYVTPPTPRRCSSGATEASEATAASANLQRAVSTSTEEGPTPRDGGDELRPESGPLAPAPASDHGGPGSDAGDPTQERKATRRRKIIKPKSDTVLHYPIGRKRQGSLQARRKGAPSVPLAIDGPDAAGGAGALSPQTPSPEEKAPPAMGSPDAKRSPTVPRLPLRKPLPALQEKDRPKGAEAGVGSP